MAGPKRMEFEFAKYPKYKQAYLRAYARMLDKRRRRGLTKESICWRTPEEVLHWQMYGNPKAIDYEGTGLFDSEASVE